MGTLKNKAQSILTEKNNKIIPENIKKNIQIFDVTGTYEGSGTTGGTARPNDIAILKTAYVDGQLITGTLLDMRNESGTTKARTELHDLDDVRGYMSLLTYVNSCGSGMILDDDTSISTEVYYSDLVDELKLLPSDLRKGVTILGVTGTYGGDGLIPIDYNKQQFVVHCGVIADILRDAVENHEIPGNHVIPLEGSGTHPLCLKLCDCKSVDGSTNKSLIPPCIGISINIEDEVTNLVLISGNDETELGAVDEYSSLDTYKSTMAVTDLIELLDDIGSVAVESTAPILSTIYLYSPLNCVSICLRDPDDASTYFGFNILTESTYFEVQNI